MEAEFLYINPEADRLVDHKIDQLIRGSVEYDFDMDEADYDDSLVDDIREFVLAA